MFKQILKGILAAILASDTANALSILQDSQSFLLDPLEGPLLHAEVLYYAIKKSNIDVIKYLLKLNVCSDLSFYHYCGHTPLSLAMEENIKEVVPDIIGKTDKNFALAMAVQQRDNKLVDLLLNKCQYKERFLRYLGLKSSCV